MAFDYDDEVSKNADAAVATEEEDHGAAMSEVMDSWKSTKEAPADNNAATRGDNNAVTKDNNEQVAFKGADNVPEVGSYAHLEHLISSGQMIQNGRFTPQAVESMLEYIQNGPANLGSILGGGASWRTSNVQNLLNQTYATGSYGTMRLDGTVPYTPPMYQPFVVNYNPGQWVPHPTQAGGHQVPASLTIAQRR